MNGVTPTQAEMKVISAGRFAAIVRAPYLASVLAAISFIRQPDLGTVAVDDRLRVYIDPDVLERWSTSELAGALLHEVNHVVRCHHLRQRLSGVDGTRWNIAADLEINDDLERAAVDLPSGVLLPAQFGLPEHELAEWYAERLVEDVSAHGGPRCGSGAGGVIGDFELGDSADVPGLSPVQLDRLRDEVARAVSARGDGVPGGLERWAHARLRSDVPWPVVLRAAVRRALPRGFGYDRHSWTRPRRHNPSSVLLPSFRAIPVHVAVVVDSSGSMSQSDLDQAVSDIAILRKLPGVDRVTVISCDTEAVEVTVPRSGAPVALVGGGGTSLGAGLAYAAALRRPVDLVVVFTDGLTDWPDHPPCHRTPVVTVMPQGAPPGPGWMTVVGYLRGRRATGCSDGTTPC